MKASEQLMWALFRLLRGEGERMCHLVSLGLEPLENLSETIQAWLTHSIQRIGPLHLAEVGRPAAPGCVENIGLAVHILDHEVLPLESEVEREAFIQAGIKNGISEAVKCFTGK